MSHSVRREIPFMNMSTASRACVILLSIAVMGPAYGADKAEDLIVFIGKRITVTEIPRPTPGGSPEDF